MITRVVWNLKGLGEELWAKGPFSGCVSSSGRQSQSRCRVTPRCLRPGRGKGWCFGGDSALSLENSRRRQVCPCRQPSLCHGCVFIGQSLESLVLPLRFTCPDVSHLLTVWGAECHSNPLPLPPTRFQAFDAASSTWSDLPHQYFYHPLRDD